jgi:transposase
MRRLDPPARSMVAARGYDNAVFVALELSRSTWLIAVNLPDSEKVSKYRVAAADTAALLSLLSRLKVQAERRCRETARVVSIHEAGLDGFWVHRLLQADGIDSHVVDAASIAVERRNRRVKTDRIDVEKLLSTLMGWARGERRICSMVRPPSPQQEDERRLTRERETLIAERIKHVNRIKGLLATQGTFEFEPLHKDRRQRMVELRCWNGQPLPPRLRAELLREVERLELVLAQIGKVEAERDQALRQVAVIENAPEGSNAGVLLVRLRGIGAEIASVLSGEALFRSFGNRREVAAYAGLTPSPWQSGGIDIEQGISKAGNSRLRRTMIQLAWLWLRNQPGSELSRWFHERVGDRRGKIRRIAIVAVARKLLVSLWRYVAQGVIPAGAVLKV